MVEAQFRARRAIARHAEAFTANGVNRKGVFAILSPGRARMYLTDSAIDSANRPIWAIVVPDDDGTAASDLISWDGLTLTILKVVKRRLRGALLFKLILAH